MDTKQETPQVPHLPLAKVGDRRRKKSGVWFWLGGSGATSPSGAIWGASGGGGGLWGTLSGMFGQSALKIAITLLAGVLAVGAYTVGKSLRPDESKYERKSALFAPKNDKTNYGDVSNLPGGAASAKSSLGMVSGNLDGLTPEERAAKAAKAKAEADAKAAAEAQAKADADAKAQAAATNIPGAGVDPAALAAAQAASASKEKEKAGAFGHRFGELSKGGSGLAGGSGLSGGIGQNFAPMIAKSNAKSGSLSAMGSNRANVTASAARISGGKNPGQMLAQRQLNRAAMMAAQTQAGANETAATAASVPFDTPDGQQQMLSGSGGASGGGATKGAADSNPTGNPSGGGGSSAPVPTYGGDSTAVDNCSQLGQQGNLGQISKYCNGLTNITNSSSGGCVCSGSTTGSDTDPTTQYFNYLKALTIAAQVFSGFLVAAAIMQFIPATMAAGFALAKICGIALTAIGGIMTALSLLIVGLGRTQEGVIFTALGAGTAAAGLMAYFTAAQAATATSTAISSGFQVLQGVASFEANHLGSNYAGTIKPRTFNADTQSWD